MKGKKKTRILMAFPIGFTGAQRLVKELSGLYPKAKVRETGALWESGKLGQDFTTWGPNCADSFDELWCWVPRRQGTVGRGTLSIAQAFGRAGKSVKVFSSVRESYDLVSIYQTRGAKWRLLPYDFEKVTLGNPEDMSLDAYSITYDEDAEEGYTIESDGSVVVGGKHPRMSEIRGALSEFSSGELFIGGGWDNPRDVLQAAAWHNFLNPDLFIFTDL